MTIISSLIVQVSLQPLSKAPSFFFSKDPQPLSFHLFSLTGQIELYTHTPLVSKLAKTLQLNYDFRICALYLLESHFIDDRPKFFAGTLSAMSAMINLECPHINILSKMDLVKRGETGGDSIKGGKSRRDLERYLDPDPTLLIDEVNEKTNPKFHTLNQAIVQLVSLEP